MRFGEKVRDLRKKHSLTQDELAKCLGVSKRTVIGWERDGRYPRNVEILEKMADIFHVPLTYIQPDQSLFIERAAATYGKKGKIEAQHLAFELTELFASGELTAQDMCQKVRCKGLSCQYITTMALICQNTCKCTGIPLHTPQLRLTAILHQKGCNFRKRISIQVQVVNHLYCLRFLRVNYKVAFLVFIVSSTSWK